MTTAPAVLSGGSSQRKLLFAVGFAIAIFLVFVPAKQLLAERSRISNLETRLVAVRAENAKLKAQVDELTDPARLELLARERLGWVRPGERAYLVVERPTETRPASRAVPQRSALSRLLDRVSRVVRGGD